MGDGWGGGRPGLVMNVLTSMCFKSTVYPWGMEQLEHGLRGNCLFHWPAAKGEEVNGKRYESVCPLRWWIRFKLEEEAFQSAALWLFHSYHLKLFSVFCSAAHSRCPHFFLIFLSPVLPFFFGTTHVLHCSRVLGLCGLTGWALRGREGKGSFHRLWDRKLRQHGLRLEHSVPQESRGHAESKRTLTLSCVCVEKKINTNPLSLIVGLQAPVPRACVHSLAYGVWSKMD